MKTILKISIVFLSLIIIVSCTKSTANPGWQEDWKAFSQALSNITKEGKFTQNDIDSVFDGKQVTWSGEITEIKSPSTEEKNPSITVNMEPITIPLGDSKSVELTRLVLIPQQEEWKTWSASKVGARVVFKTTLKKKEDIPGWGVFSILQGMGENEGKILAFISTQNATMIRLLDAQSSGVQKDQETEKSDVLKQVPRNLRTDAQKAFDEGKMYFIWPDEKGTIKCEGKPHDIFRLLQIPFSFVSNQEMPTEYAPVVTIFIKDSDSGQLKESSIVSAPTEKSEIKSQGGGTAIYVVQGQQLQGEGTAKVFLIKKSEKDENTGGERIAISNEFTVKVSF